MSFPLFLEDLNEVDKQEIYNETKIEPKSETEIPKSILAKLPSGASAMLNKVGETFSFFNVLPSKKQLSLPFFYARSKLGYESVPGDGIWSTFSDERLFATKIELRDYQIKVIEEAMGQLKSHGTTTIVLPPGRGKTIIGTCLATFLRLKTAYIFPSNISSLQGQWFNTHEKVYSHIDNIKDHIIFPPEPSKGTRFPWPEDFNFILTTDLRTTSIPDSIADQIGTVVIDEGHLLCTKSRVTSLLRFSPKYVIVLTATPERNDGAHKMLSLLAGPHGVFEKVSNEFKVLKKKVDLFIPEKTSRTGTMDYTSFCSELASSKEYNEAIINIIINNPHRKIIVLSKLVAHVETLASMVRDKGLSCETMFGKKKTHYDTNVLIGTTQKISVGYDAGTAVEDFNGVAADTLILTHGVRQWQNFEQSKGRVMRSGGNNPPVIVWLTTRNNILGRHLSGLKKYIESTGGKISELKDNLID